MRLALLRTATLMDATTNPPPAIPVQSADSDRPSLSVMIPTHEPKLYLVAALRSVLQQDLGPKEMQIAVVDDASHADVRSLIDQADAGGRVELYTCTANRGISENWNECLRLAKGRIIHLLHQDDLIADGFYRRMLPSFTRQPQLGMAFCRHAFIDSQGRRTRLSHREKWFAGVLDSWLERIATKQRIQCPAVLVRRSAYEIVGGYRSDLRYALDWEMWVRIAAHYKVWYEPKVLASYRRHEENESARLQSAGNIGRDIVRAIEIIGSHLPDSNRDRIVSDAYESFARTALKRLQRETRSPVEITSLLEPVKIAVLRITDPPHRAEHLKKLLANIEQGTA